MVRDIVPPPPAKTIKSEILFQGDGFYIERITQTIRGCSFTEHKVVALESCEISLSKVSEKKSPITELPVTENPSTMHKGAKQ